MLRIRFSTALAGVAIASLVPLAGCSFGGLTGATVTPSAGSVSAEPTESTVPVTPSTAVTTPAEGSTSTQPATGETLAPGGVATGSAQIKFVGTDDKSAIFSHRIVEVVKATDAEYEELAEKIKQLKNYDVWFVNVESSYVSGDDLAYSSFSTHLEPVDSDRDDLQNLSLIGYKSCSSGSIPSPGDDSSSVIKNCRATAVPKGAAAPAGIKWDQYDTDYADEPAFIMKG